MKRPLLLGVLLLAALVGVIISKSYLDKLVKEGKTSAVDELPPANTIDIGIQQDEGAGQDAASSNPHPVHGKTQQDVMAILVQTRQELKNRNEARQEAGADPHRTPGAIINSAQKIGEIITLERTNPEFKGEIQSFYLDCAKDQDVLTVTRVQCVERYILSKELKGDAVEEFLKPLPSEVTKLYREINPQ